MHISRYMFRFQVEDGRRILLYNPLSGAIDLVSPRTMDLLQAASYGDDKVEIDEEDLAYFSKRGYIYKTREEEDRALIEGYQDFEERQKVANIRFVLIPTYQCNARCSYCFIGDSIGQDDIIDDQTIAGAFRAMTTISGRHDLQCVKQLSLFGGEPLRNHPLQQKRIESILSLAAARGYVVDVVSNGMDLAHYADMLQRYGVSVVQVTFDGPKDYHNQRRRSVDGRGNSFDRIVEGIATALDRGIAVNARILLDRNSIRRLSELASFMADQGWFNQPRFGVHIGSVFDCFRCQPPEETARHLSVEEGNRLLLEICRQDRSLADRLSMTGTASGASRTPEGYSHQPTRPASAA